jgi:AcrR family transcriptional regulator
MRRLPEGHDPHQIEQLSRPARERILAAMAEIVAKRGYQGTTVEHIVKRAGVSRGTFYEIFENREACLLAGFDEAVAAARGLVSAAVAEHGEWPDRVRAGLAAALAWVATNPALARTCLVESMTAGPAGLARYEAALRGIAPAVAGGRELAEDPGELPDTLEDSLVGGVVWVVRQRLLRAEAEAVPALLPTTLEFVLAPYLGEERAAELAAAA